MTILCEDFERFVRYYLIRAKRIKIGYNKRTGKVKFIITL